MQNLMNRELLQIPYSKLLKLEVYKLAKEMSRVLGNHDAEVLKIGEMETLFSGLTPKIDALKVYERGHFITPKLKSPREKRNLYVSALAFQLKVITKEDLTGEDDAVLMIRKALNRFFEKLSESKNETIKNSKVEQFLDEIKQDVALNTALSENGFNDITNNLESSLTNLEYFLNTKLTSLSGRVKVKTNDLKKPVIEGIKNVMSEIKLAKLKNPALDYRPLIAEMNELLSHNAFLINRREADNKRKAEERLAKNGGEKATASPTVETNGLVMTPSVLLPTTNGYFEPKDEKVEKNELNEDLALSLKQKKAAASSAKHVQLPNSKNEADL